MGDKYRPSNGSEGEFFKDKFCRRCQWFKWHNFGGMKYQTCPIELATTKYEEDSDKYPNQWTYDEDGKPICTEFREVENG